MSDYRFKNKKKEHIRDESERRDKVTSLRSSENELRKIKKNAKDAGMTVNSFLNNVGANGMKLLTPALTLIGLPGHGLFLVFAVDIVAAAHSDKIAVATLLYCCHRLPPKNL